ncbi:hypothetical protein CSIM01_07963 [Colletotrichum simmondsii]|uniref:Uncharacterized protein n=1 Tax=Colletotrichum simmondsii TaxID=703756 RepID=A0A135S587_9PEZI|nr:hypothetical protein CSIM01_07963 [Colletotrichum simmondsii]
MDDCQTHASASFAFFSTSTYLSTSPTYLPTYHKDRVEEGVPFVITANQNRCWFNASSRSLPPNATPPIPSGPLPALPYTSGQRIVRSPARLPHFAYYDCDDEPIGPADPAIPRLCARSPSPLTSTVYNIYNDLVATKAPSQYSAKSPHYLSLRKAQKTKDVRVRS